MDETIEGLLDDLMAIAEMGNKMIGYPICAAPCEHGGTCSLDTGHDGFHISRGSSGEELCTWEAEWVR